VQNTDLQGTVSTYGVISDHMHTKQLR